MARHTLQAVSDKYLGRIAALLRKAEATDNEHEADAFLQAAQRLATAASIDLAVARAHTAATERRTTPTQRIVQIGEAGKRGLRTYVQLFLAISGANDVKCDIASNSTRVFAYGFDSDIDTVEALYSSLVVQMVRSCDNYLRSDVHRSDMTYQRVRQGHRIVEVAKPVHGTTARINFQQAFATRIAKRLTAAREAAIAEQSRSPAQEQGSATGVALVLRAKEIEITDHYRANSQARGAWDGYRATAGYSAQAGRAGDRAGRTARLGGEKAIGGSRTQVER